MPYSRVKPVPKKRSVVRPKELLLIAVAVVLAAGVVLAGLEWTNTTHLFHHTKTPTYPVAPTANANTKGQGAVTTGPSVPSSGSTNGSGSTTPGSAKDQSSDGSSPNSGDSGQTLITPTGPFVSSHHVSTSTTIQSVCNTTSGASCSITFTNGGTTKSLAVQNTDAGGATYWYWKPSDIGLTSGSWTVTATATLGSQTKTASDAQNLEVSP
ncbi:MAG TPA: hypothetical protein VLF91_01975 [Candidatus Saccharimonadales bacterium]|nr:hypothetical protein [Candidatus Saccharimonadales bacterium]